MITAIEMLLLLGVKTAGAREHCHVAAVYGAMQTLVEGTTLRVAPGSLYPTVDRLESKGLVSTWLRRHSPRKSGRPRRYIVLTPEGEAALQEYLRLAENAIRAVADGEYQEALAG